MRMNEKTGARATSNQFHRKHIFVVNGSPDFLDIMRDLLQDEQFNVTTTNYVPDTFAQIEAAEPNLLIADLAVGEQAGWELLAELRKAATTREIPIILVSTTERLLQEARDHHAAFGGDRYLVKPFELEDLVTMIGDLVGQA